MAVRLQEVSLLESIGTGDAQAIQHLLDNLENSSTTFSSEADLASVFSHFANHRKKFKKEFFLYSLRTFSGYLKMLSMLASKEALQLR